MSIILCILCLLAEALLFWALLSAEGLTKGPNPPVKLGPCRDERHEWEA